MPIKTVSLNQQGHTITCGVVSKENTDTHEFIFKMVKKAAEEVVNDRITKGFESV